LPRIGPAIENFNRKHDLSRGVLSDKFGDAENGCLKYRVHEFDVETAAFRGAVFRRLEESSESLKELIEVEDGRWESGGRWLCHKVHKKTYLEGGRREDEYFEEYVLQTTLTPDDLLEDDLKPGYRNLRGLYKRIRLEPERMNLRLAFHNRFTQPLSAIVLLLIGLPPVVGSERFAKNRVLGIGVSLLVGGAFYLVSFVCEHLGTHRYIPVAGLAAWTPVVMFGALGIYFFDSMRT
jgi:lipopolysaccharide export LptBFGC system permease protein LptF